MSEEKHCYGCKYYKPYYIKGYKQFDRCDIGLCSKTKTTVERHGACEKFESMYYARVSRKQAALQTLAEHINEDDTEAIEELFYNFKKRKK